MVKNTKSAPKYKEISLITSSSAFNCKAVRAFRPVILSKASCEKCNFIHALGVPVLLSHQYMEEFSWLQCLKAVFIVTMIVVFNCALLIAL